MSKWILRAAVVGLLATGVASAQSTMPAPVSTYPAPRTDLGVKVFQIGDLVSPPKGSPLAIPGDDDAMKAAAEAYTKVKVTALKADIQNSIEGASWAEVRGTRLEYFAIGQSLLVINTPAAIAQVEQHLDTMRMVKNTFVQVEVKLFKVPGDTESVKKLFGDKATATMTAEELKTLMEALTKSGVTETIMAPRVTVNNKQTGVFETLQKVPGNDTPVGVSCRMTPAVTDDKKSIQLRIDLTHSTPSVNKVQLGHGQTAQPVDSQQTNTTLSIPNGGTGAVRVGIHKVQQHIEQKVPVLGDLPLVDRLFRNQAIAVMPIETIAVFTVSQVKPDDKAVLPPLPAATMPQYLPRPTVRPVQYLTPMTAAPTMSSEPTPRQR